MGAHMPELEERIAVLETNQIHMRQQISEMAAKVDEMHELLLQAKGARYVVVFAAALGGFVASKLGALAGFFGTKM